MNDLLSGLGNSRNNGSCNTKECGCNNGGIGGIGSGNNSIIWIIILLCFCGQGKGQGTVCGCKKKHCKEYCSCGSNNSGGIFGGLGSGSGSSCWWIIILIFLFTCNGKQNKGCTTNIINLDDCDDE